MDVFIGSEADPRSETVFKGASWGIYSKNFYISSSSNISTYESVALGDIDRSLTVQILVH